LNFDKWVQLEELISAGNDFVPILEGFVHMAFDFSPTIGYVACREDFDLESLKIVQP